MANANFVSHRGAKAKYKTKIVRPFFTGLEFVGPQFPKSIFFFFFFNNEFLLQQWFTILWHELMANVHFVQQLKVFTDINF